MTVNNWPLTRAERLHYINEIIADKYGFAPRTDESLGRYPKTPEILNLVDVQELGKGRIEATFRIIDMDGEEKDVKKMFGGTMMIVIALVTQKVDGAAVTMVQMARRWRIDAAGSYWSVELPQGLEFDSDDTDFIGAFESPSHRVLARTFGPDFVRALGAARVIPLHELYLKSEGAPAKVMLVAADPQGAIGTKPGDGMRIPLRGPELLSLIDKGETLKDDVVLRLREGNTVAALLHSARGKLARYFS